MNQQPNYTAVLKNSLTIQTAVTKKYDTPYCQDVRLFADGQFIEKLVFVSRSESKSTFIYTFSFSGKMELGRLYELADGRNEFAPLDISFLAGSEAFEKEFRYDGELGAIYSKEKTVFRVFSPLASEVIVGLADEDNKKSYCSLKRLKCGVYQGEEEGDLDGCKYIIIARINGVYKVTADPYAKALGLNSRYGFIVNMDKLSSIPLNDEKLPPFSHPSEASVYELDIRDMTSLTSLPNKGTYNALSSEGLKDEKGNPIGIDYIASLGVSHVQLMPTFDFQTLADEDPFRTYNWGYDPEFYFVPEGSYSSKPDDAYCRLYEFRSLIAAFHKKGIRVNMDVVFNHTFQVYTQAMNILCPNYCYRVDKEDNLLDGTGCGNEVESRKYMVRKLIIDCLVFYVTNYGLDGFRFDLMGLIDKKTISDAVYSVKGLKPNAMIYGEGWDMASSLPSSEKASMNNSSLLPDVGFFNDRFRDVCKGHCYGDDNCEKGYLSGEAAYRDGFKHVFMGSSVAFAFPPLFVSPDQSVNYVECHDGLTMFDKLKVIYPKEKEETLLRRIKLINACVVFSYGIAFIHEGQEFGHSKNGASNSYNSSDAVNGFDYSKAYEHLDMIRYLKAAIEMKKSCAFLQWNQASVIEKRINFVNLENGALEITFDDKETKKPIARLFVNPSLEDVKVAFDKPSLLLFDENGKAEEKKEYESYKIKGLALALFTE